MREVNHIRLPLTQDQARDLRVGDVVFADGEIVITAGYPTHQRLVAFLEAGDPLPMRLHDQAFLHIGICCEETGGELTPSYINPTTSTRFNAMMPRLIRELRLTSVGGKGGLGAEAVAAMAEVGCVYFSMVGGASAMLSGAVKDVVETAWDDLVMQFRLTRLTVQAFGPLTVAIDAHGGSVYESLAKDARDALPDILQTLAMRRGA